MKIFKIKFIEMLRLFTMFHLVGVFAIVAFHSAFAQIDCVPEHVGNITLDLNYTLYWQPSTNCDSTNYMIYIHAEDGLQFIYNTEEPHLDVSFLPACELFNFQVMAFSEHQLSEERHLEAYIPVSSGANLTMSSFSVIREDETLFLIWAVEEKFAHCARGFRVIVREDWEILPKDFYTRNNYLFVDGSVPCGKYEIGVMAIYNEVMEGPVAFTTYTHPPYLPDPVDELALSINYTLSWLPSTNCDVTHYIVYIHSEDDNLEYIYMTDLPNLDVSFLPACERYRFSVMAYDEHMSSQSVIITRIPAPPGANLTINNFTVVEQEEGVKLNWGVDYQYAHCAQFYRVIIWDYETTPRDIYTSYNDFILDDLSPCTNYEFAVRAIYNLEIEGPPAVHTYEAPPIKSSNPVLERIVAGNTYVNLMWSLPSYRENRCPITAFTVDGSPYFNTTIPINDSPDRPPFTTNLSPLRQDTMYFFRVTVTNSAGLSTPYPLAVQTLGSN